MIDGIVGIFGNGVHDAYVEPRSMTRDIECLHLEFETTSISFQVPLTCSKIAIETPPREFLRHSIKTKSGGGGVNSRIAASMITCKSEIRYLDANKRDRLLEASIPAPQRFLGLRHIGTNFVFGHRDDKIIFRSPIPACGALTAMQLKHIAWLCEGQMVLLNSPKDRDPVKAIFDQKAIRDFKVISVLTPSMDREFATTVIIPRSDILIGAWDDLGFIIGCSVQEPGDAKELLVRLREIAPDTEIHVTMSKRGAYRPLRDRIRFGILS